MPDWVSTFSLEFWVWFGWFCLCFNIFYTWHNWNRKRTHYVWDNAHRRFCLFADNQFNSYVLKFYAALMVAENNEYLF